MDANWHLFTITMHLLAVPVFGVFFGDKFFTRPDFSLVKLLFFHGTTFYEYEEYGLHEADRIFNHKNFDPNVKTVIYSHGFKESGKSKSVRQIVNAYLARNDHNIIVLDWTSLSTERYFFSALPNTKEVGTFLGNVLTNLYYDGVNIENIHLVGFSLGAHLCGTVGRVIKQNTNGTVEIPRITGLDPGFPGYYVKPYPRHISSEDATFVDIIHTDGSLAGAPVSTGTVDFWPNGGKFIQPGCAPRKMQISDPCSHRRAWEYWAESLVQTPGRKFVAVKAKSWFHFIFGRFTEPRQYATMGIDSSPKNYGNYYLETNGKPPYGKGKRGTYLQRQSYHAIFSQFFLFQLT